VIRQTVWPQYTNVKDRQTDGTDIQDRQRSDSIGRTVLQTVAQKIKQFDGKIRTFFVTRAS